MVVEGGSECRRGRQDPVLIGGLQERVLGGALPEGVELGGYVVDASGEACAHGSYGEMNR